MRTYGRLTIAEAYRRGYKAFCADYDAALDRFIERYCDHGDLESCDVCVAWQNGYADQADPGRAWHARICPRGLSDRGNHEDCSIP